MPVFTAAAAYIATSIGVTSLWGIAAINFGVRVLATVVVSSLITRMSNKPGAQAGASAPSGTRVQVPPATNNKLPVSYGNAYLSPVIIDAKISTDQQYMWYVMAFSEVTDTGTINYNDPDNISLPLCYWGDKKMQFDSSDRTKVTGLIDMSTGSPVVDTKINGYMNVYFYSNGSSNPLYGTSSAITILSDSSTGGGIPVDQRWTSTDTMSKVAFCIVRMKYNQDANLTGLQQVTAYVRNSLTEPGSVLVDYLTNDIYGCAIPLANVNTDAFTGTNGLDDYSNELISYNDGASVKTQPRYRINGPLDVSKDCLTNLQQLTDACDSWLQWNETLGQWSVIVNKPYNWDGTSINDLFTIYSDTVMADSNQQTPATNYGYVVGGVDITPVDLNATFNRVEVQFPSELIKDQTDYAYIELTTGLNPNEPINSLTIQLPQVNDSVQAQYIGTRRLEQARDDLLVTLTTDYSGIQIDAGDVVRVYHEMYGWTSSSGFPDGKLFRVTQVQETKTDDGSLGARLSLSEYNGSIYGDGDITAFTPAANTGITDPTIIAAPNAPVVTATNATAAIPTFTVSVSSPALPRGTVIGIELWYAVASTTPTNMSSYKLYETQFYNSGAVYPSTYTQTFTMAGLPSSGTQQYFFVARAVGSRSKSGFSTTSTGYTWAPNPTSTVTGQNFQSQYQPNPVMVGLYANGDPILSSVLVQLYGLSGPGQVDYANVSSNASMVNNQWRIDKANIVYSGITFPSDPVEGTGGTYAVWPAPTAMAANVATITTPIIYKDSTGTLYEAPPAIVSLNKMVPGQEGERGILAIVYIPVGYDPTTASDSTLTTSFNLETGYSGPIDGDGAVFYRTADGLQSTRQYNSLGSPSLWVPTSLAVPGTIITNDSISGSQIKGNTIGSNNISGNAITSTKIANSAVTTDKIANATISAAKIQQNAIVSDLINQGAITEVKISNSAITSPKIAAGAITADKLAANFVYAGNVVSLNSELGNVNAPGFWLSSDGNAHFANNVSIGGVISLGAINPQVITTENLIYDSVTQSRTSIDFPESSIIPYLTWPTYSGSPTPSWSDNTRGMVPSGGVKIVPQGGRIQIDFSASIHSNAYPEMNVIEVWKDGTNYEYAGVTITHLHQSLDRTTAQNAPTTLHALGQGVDLISSNGGDTWTTASTPTNKIISAGITTYYNDYTTPSLIACNTTVVGPLQPSDFTASDYKSPANWGCRNWQGPNAYPYTTSAYPIKYVYQLQNYTNQYSNYFLPYTLYDMSLFYGDEVWACGSNGVIVKLIGGSQVPGWPIYRKEVGWFRNSTISTRPVYYTYNDLYSIIPQGGGFMAVGANGTILYTNNGPGPSTMVTNPKNEDGEDVFPNLFSVKYSTTCWIAVGEGGTIARGTRDPSTGYINFVVLKNQMAGGYQETNTLRDIVWANTPIGGIWMAVGDNERILYSLDDGLTWYYGLSPSAVEPDFKSVIYSTTNNKFVVAGNDIIINAVYNDIQTGWQVRYTGTANRVVTGLTRMWSQGSNPNDPFDTTTQPVYNRVPNDSTVSGTIIDNDAVPGIPVSYYLVMGNLGGYEAWTGAPSITVTEYKR